LIYHNSFDYNAKIWKIIIFIVNFMFYTPKGWSFDESCCNAQLLSYNKLYLYEKSVCTFFWKIMKNKTLSSKKIFYSFGGFTSHKQKVVCSKKKWNFIGRTWVAQNILASEINSTLFKSLSTFDSYIFIKSWLTESINHDFWNKNVKIVNHISHNPRFWCKLKKPK